MKLFYSTQPSISTLAHQRLTKYGFTLDEIGALSRFVDTAPDTELYRINPRRIANRTGLSLHRAAEIGAMCVREGIFDLHWASRCPACRGVTETYGSLHDVRGTSFCEYGDGGFDIRLDEDMLVEFALHPNVRKLNLPHEALRRYYSFPAQGIEAHIAEQMPHVPTHHRSQIAQILRIRDEHLPMSGLELLHVPMFHDFFTDEVLPVNVSLKVTRVAIVFTDLRGSTALYAAKGDPQAYALVRQHFDILLAETIVHNGVVLKTIGDAVMASFTRTEDAVAAAIAFQHKMMLFNQAHNLLGDDRLILKVGLHAGPCLSVTLNKQPDYFGTMVNVAARLNTLSRGDDIIVTQDVLDDPAASQTLQRAGLSASESTAVRLRGFTTETHVVRYASVPVLAGATG